MASLIAANTVQWGCSQQSTWHMAKAVLNNTDHDEILKLHIETAGNTTDPEKYLKRHWMEVPTGIISLFWWIHMCDRQKFGMWHQRILSIHLLLCEICMKDKTCLGRLHDRQMLWKILCTEMLNSTGGGSHASQKHQTLQQFTKC